VHDGGRLIISISGKHRNTRWIDVIYQKHLMILERNKLLLAYLMGIISMPLSKRYFTLSKSDESATRFIFYKMSKIEKICSCQGTDVYCKI
jgi:hypothetical protein